MKIVVVKTSVVGRCRRCGHVTCAWTESELRDDMRWHERLDNLSLGCVAQNSELTVEAGRFVHEHDLPLIVPI